MGKWGGRGEGKEKGAERDIRRTDLSNCANEAITNLVSRTNSNIKNCL